MKAWLWILGACAIAYATKLAGWLVPHRLLDRPLVKQVSASVTIGLLTALVLSNTLSVRAGIALDARLAALVAAVIALLLRAPFVVVVIVGAMAAALARLAGV